MKTDRFAEIISSGFLRTSATVSNSHKLNIFAKPTKQETKSSRKNKVSERKPKPKEAENVQVEYNNFNRDAKKFSIFEEKNMESKKWKSSINQKKNIEI